MTNIFKVQTATPQDFQAIAALNIAAYREYAKDLTDQAWITLQTTLSAVETVAGRGVFLIVSIDEELAGSVAYCPPGNSIDPIPSAWASILLLAVAPHYRGQGIGQKLVETCIQRAREDQAQVIGLFTNELMTTACKLYRSLGFREDGAIPQRLGLRYWRYRLNLAIPNLIKFSTERLHLRQWCAADREPFAQLNADSRVMEFLPKMLNRTASDALLARLEAQISDRGWGLWAAEIKATQELIGFVGLNVPVPELPFSPCVEVGWRLAFQYWGKGYATEAARESLRIGFEMLNLDEIVSFTTIENRRSRAVMERLKMREMPDTFRHPLLPIDHPLSEHCLYIIRK